MCDKQKNMGVSLHFGSHFATEAFEFRIVLLFVFQCQLVVFVVRLLAK